jgi:DNA-binding MarR family transcriptional regulator
VARYILGVHNDLTQQQYAQLLQLRTGLRRFLHWSEERAEEHGLTPAQHQLLLAVRGSDARHGPTIGELSHALVLRHHSVVGLVDRAQRAGLVTRRRDPTRQSLVHVRLTDCGRQALRGLALVHLREITELAPAMQALWQAIAAAGDSPAGESTVAALTVQAQ